MAEKGIGLDRTESDLAGEHSPRAAAERKEFARGYPGAVIEAGFRPMFRLLIRCLPGLAHAFGQRRAELQFDGEATDQAGGVGLFTAIDRGNGELIESSMQGGGDVQRYRIAPAFGTVITLAGRLAIDQELSLIHI